MFLEDFGAKYHYIKGKDNVLADSFSCLPRMDSWQNSEGKSDAIDEDTLWYSNEQAPLGNVNEVMDCCLYTQD